MRNLLYISVVVFLISGCSNGEERLIKCADKIHASIFTVDTHCDTPMEFSDSTFDLGVRHAHGVVVRRVGVPQTGQHVRDRVGHRHGQQAFLTAVSRRLSPAPGPAVCSFFLVTNWTW